MSVNFLSTDYLGVMADVRDILDLEPSAAEVVTRESFMGSSEKVKKKPKALKEVARRPEGMHRELYALLYTDNKDAPPLFPTDTGMYYIVLCYCFL